MIVNKYSMKIHLNTGRKEGFRPPPFVPAHSGAGTKGLATSPGTQEEATYTFLMLTCPGLIHHPGQKGVGLFGGLAPALLSRF